MPEFFSIPDLGEARLSLKEYDDMREEIRTLKQREQELTDMLDHVCEENKVRVRRQIIRSRELTTNPRACGQQEIIEDRLVNMGDIESDVKSQFYKDMTNRIQSKERLELDRLKEENESLNIRLDRSHERIARLRKDIDLLKHRNWWERLWNK